MLITIHDPFDFNLHYYWCYNLQCG